jgi:hypothetical protein
MPRSCVFYFFLSSLPASCLRAVCPATVDHTPKGTDRHPAQELDTALKLACEDFITASSLSLTSSLRAFLDRCTTFLSTNSSSPLVEQDWAAPQVVLALAEETTATIEEGVRQAGRRMRGWLQEEKTVRVLVPPMLEEVGEVYSTFHNREPCFPLLLCPPFHPNSIS